MKCPNCGCDNPDIRLFCAHCGELLPETEEPAQVNQPDTAPDDDIRIYQKSNRQGKDDFSEEKIPTSVLETPDDTDFYRRRERARRVYEEAWPEAAAPEPPKKEVASIFDMDDTASTQPSPAPVQGVSRAPELGRSSAHDSERPSTYLPARDDELDPDSFFDVRGRSSSFDADRPVNTRKSKLRRGDEFEDSDRQSFAVRHMRGIVTLALMLFTLAIVVIWAITPDAQLALAKLDMAWSAAAYEKLGLEAWESGDFETSGHYFTQALKRDPGNSGYAIYAANSYIETGNMTKAAEAIRKCIAAEPNNAEYYVALMSVYSGYENLPDADRLLVDEGYRRTGDSRLENNNVED